jgi:hypothetical protein
VTALLIYGWLIDVHSRYNQLLATVRNSLSELLSAMAGMTVLSQEAELSLAAVAHFKVGEGVE